MLIIILHLTLKVKAAIFKVKKQKSMVFEHLLVKDFRKISCSNHYDSFWLIKAAKYGQVKKLVMINNKTFILFSDKDEPRTGVFKARLLLILG